MPTIQSKKISIIAPVHNEEANIPLFHEAVSSVVATLPHDYEIIFVNDGSTDGSGAAIVALAEKHPSVKYLEFSRNFGKEVATTAGLHAATGDAAILIDTDLQHPAELIPEFIRHWEAGADVVVGVRRESKSDSVLKRSGSRAFYAIMRRISETDLTPRATDFRLLDRAVIDAFAGMTERERMTRGLVDWLGFRRQYVPFDARERLHGTASYTTWHLVKLATSGFISHSLIPLKLAAYLGVAITLGSLGLGAVMLLDRVMGWGMHFSGPAILAALILFLIGVVLICIGLLAYYIGHIFRETQNRPMYVVRRRINIDQVRRS